MHQNVLKYRGAPCDSPERRFWRHFRAFWCIFRAPKGISGYFGASLGTQKAPNSPNTEQPTGHMPCTSHGQSAPAHSPSTLNRECLFVIALDCNGLFAKFKKPLNQVDGANFADARDHHGPPADPPRTPRRPSAVPPPTPRASPTPGSCSSFPSFPTSSSPAYCSRQPFASLPAVKYFQFPVLGLIF